MRRISGVRPFVAAVAAISIAALACGGGGGSGAGGTTSTGGSGDAGACPVGAIDKAGKPVDITLWHSMTRANEDAFTKFKAGLASGELPDLVQIEDTGLQLMIDSQAVLPAQDCVDAVDYDTSDYLDRVLAYYTVDGTLWPVPFNVSNPILYYDRAAFERAGLDPDDPPTTFDDVETAARAIVGSNAAGAGIAIKLDPWLLEQWSALAGATYVDHGNGREERARAVTFDGEAGLEIFEWLNRMADEGLATITGPGGFDNLLAIGSHGAAMTVDTSAALGTIAQVLSGGDYADVSLGVGPMPGGSGEGGILVGGAALYILNTSSPARSTPPPPDRSSATTPACEPRSSQDSRPCSRKDVRRPTRSRVPGTPPTRPLPSTTNASEPEHSLRSRSSSSGRTDRAWPASTRAAYR